MWKSININGKKYFKRCSRSEDKLDFVLFDPEANESWRETVTLSAEHVMQPDGHMRYHNDIIFATVQSAEPLKTELQITPVNTIRLTLEYLIESNPFHFELNLQKQNEKEVTETIIIPLFLSMQTLSQQISHLREVINKKDKEIAQYKFENGSLRRRTVATVPFNSAEFDARFLELTKGLPEVAEHVSKLVNPEAASSALVISNKQVKEAKIVGPLNRSQMRKRKAKELQERHLLNKIKAQQAKMTYESSQSQSQNCSQNVILEVTKVEVKDCQSNNTNSKDQMESSEAQARSQEISEIFKALNDLESQRIEDLKRRNRE